MHLVDVETGQTETYPAGRRIGQAANVRWSPDGRSLFWLTDRGSDFLYLAKYDLATATETKLWDKLPWDVELFSLSDDGMAGPGRE